MSYFHIIGAGPAGLAIAYYLSTYGHKSIVYEKHEIPGGMGRSWIWQDFILDTGPHILHTPQESIWLDWKSLLGDDLFESPFYSANLKQRNGRNYLFDYPINTAQILTSSYWSASNLDRVREQLGATPNPSLCASATSFKEYTSGLVGDLLTNEFFTDYPEKVWGKPVHEMLPDWAPKRIRRTTSLEPFFGDQFCGISGKGTGELFRKISQYITERGSKLFFKTEVTGISHEKGRISRILLKNKPPTTLGQDDVVISTLPITLMAAMAGRSYSLDYRGVASVYIAVNGKSSILPDPYHWLYFSDKKTCFNRITEPTKLCADLNLSSEKLRTYLIAETTFYSGSFGFCKELNITSLIDKTIKDIIRLGFLSDRDSIIGSSANIEPFVYPLQTQANSLELKRCKAFLSSFHNLETLGTSADFAYNDMQVIFCQAKELAGDLLPASNLVNLNRISFNRLTESHNNNKPIAESTKNGFLLIAEVGINHNGDIPLLHQMITDASESADIIKLQMYRASRRVGYAVRELNHVELAQDVDENLYQLLNRCELSNAEILSSLELVRSLGKIPMCTAFDLESLEFLLDAGLQHVKIASMDLVNISLHKRLVNHQYPLNIYISTGLSSFDEISSVAQMYRGTHHDVCLLLCISSYPTPNSQLNIRGLKTLQTLGFPVGYSDHTVNLSAVQAALSQGAVSIEVHFTSNRNMAGPDQLISKTKQDLQLIRQCGDELLESLGSNVVGLVPAEFETWKSQRKSLHAATDISKGSILTTDNTIAISPPVGLSPVLLLSNTLQAMSEIKAGSPITLDNVSVTPMI